MRTTGFLVFTHAATRAPCGDEASSGSAVGGVGGRTEKGGEEAAEGYFSDGTRSIRGGGKRQCWGRRASATVGSSSAPRRYPQYQRRGTRDPPHTSRGDNPCLRFPLPPSVQRRMYFGVENQPKEARNSR